MTRMQHPVHIQITGPKLAKFACPACGRTVRLARAYPFDFGHARCKGCGTVWSNLCAADFRVRAGRKTIGRTKLIPAIGVREGD